MQLLLDKTKVVNKIDLRIFKNKNDKKRQIEADYIEEKTIDYRLLNEIGVLLSMGWQKKNLSFSSLFFAIRM